MIATSILWMILGVAPTLVADVQFSFREQNGVGWVTVDGRSTVTLSFERRHPSLHVVGKKRVIDALLVTHTEIETKTSDPTYDDLYDLTEVTKRGEAVSFVFKLHGETISGQCAPVTLEQLERNDLFECSFEGFRWSPNPQLPEVRQAFIASTGGRRMVNTISGSVRKDFGERKVSQRK